jgi:uncharacterized membrane protein
MTPTEERRIHQAFLLSLGIKGLDAVVEVAAAIFLAVARTDVLSAPFLHWAHKELVEHPEDRIAAFVQQAALSFTHDARIFAALYLGSHGLVKLILVAALFRNLAWAYPVSLAAFGAFIVYQLYRFTFTHSIFLLVLTVFDLVVIVLIWHEWRVRRTGQLPQGAGAGGPG